MQKYSLIIKIALIGVLGALLLVSLVSRQEVTVYAFDLTISMQIFDQGYTVIDLPPLGTIRAQTHQLPLMFRVSLNNINLQRLSELVTEVPDVLIADIETKLVRQVWLFMLRVMAIAFIGGFGAGYVYARNLKQSITAGIAGLLVFAILLGVTVSTYDYNAFIAPEFEGVIEAAPWLMGVAEEALAAVENIDAQVQIITSNLFFLFESLNFLRPLGTIDGDVKILHVSDIHNNPIAISLIGQMVTSFAVDIIIDTGDITDYGTPVEAELLSQINELGIPYVFVPGNHDSPAVLSSFNELENVFVLEAGIHHFDELDLTIAGIADPAASDTRMAVRPRQEYHDAADKLRALIEADARKPDIIAAHHSFIIDDLTDLADILLHGHSHRVSIEQRGQAVIIDAGSTGGAGIRGLMTRDEIPFSMVLLHLNKVGDKWQPLAADIIKVNNINAGFILERQLLRPYLPFPDSIDNDDE